jgi:outer membrane receptor for ferrienterochelin and colicins
MSEWEFHDVNLFLRQPLVHSAQSESALVYANASEDSVRGVTLALDAQLTSQLSIYTNYQFTQGNRNDHWQAVEHTARNKWNIGLNWLTLDDKLNISLRSNIVGSRKVPLSNGYYTEYALGYEKTNLTLSWNDLHWGSFLGIIRSPADCSF